MTHSDHFHRRPARIVARGFALVVTLALMILLTVIAIGLLSLSTISLRQSRASTDMAEAMANARLSLMLALGDLQKQMGKDTRISAAADQLQGATLDTSAADVNRRQWIGVYDAWPAAASPDTRPAAPTFRQWLVSGNTSDLISRDFAKSAGTATGTRELVGLGTLGASATEGMVTVPTIDLLANGKTTSRLAWWVGDQGMKAAMSTTQAPTPADLTAVRAGLQGAPRNAVQLAKAGSSTLPFGALADNDARLPFVSDFNQMGLLASSPKDHAPLFHDLVSHSSGLLTNVRTGGFRKDLSIYFEKATPPTGGFPLGISSDALYQVNGVDGIRGAELWSYYNLYKQLKTGSISFTSGGTGGGTSNPYLQTVDPSSSTPFDAQARADKWFYFKHPVIVGYMAKFSFFLTAPSGTPSTSKLALCVDPVITFWNPYDVPLSLAPGYNTFRFETIPYQITNLQITSTDPAFTPVTIPALNLGMTDTTVTPNIPGIMPKENYVVMRAGNQPFPSDIRKDGEPLVLKPGEVLFYSQPSAEPIVGSSTASFISAKHNLNNGGGVYYLIKQLSGTPPVNTSISTKAGSTMTVNYATIQPNNGTNTSSAWGKRVAMNYIETYFLDDRTSTTASEVIMSSTVVGGAMGQTVGIGGTFVDFICGQSPDYRPNKPDSMRFYATSKPSFFKKILVGSADLVAGPTLSDRKKWFLNYAYGIKTENDSQRPGQFLSRFNPSGPLIDFEDLSDAELDLLPFEIRIQSNTSGSALSSPYGLDYDPISKRGLIGGGLTPTDGTTFMTTHSVPREPLISLASLQHSLANGFTHDSPVLPDTGTAVVTPANPSYKVTYSNTTLGNQSIRLPMLPQIAHAIGNSLAPAVLAADKTEGVLTGRPLADHSYLANKALWDDWFFSGIAPKPSAALTQKTVAENFLNGSAALPVSRYRPSLGTETATAALARLFSGTAQTPLAKSLTASMIRVDGLFNVNSTSIEAWKAVLGGLKNHAVATRNENGTLSQTANTGSTPVSGLLAPTAAISGTASTDPKDAAQWTGRRTLSDTEIDTLAKKLVEEVRRSGPFLSLSDFINRRPGTNTDTELARAGAVQSAIDAAAINTNYSSRIVDTTISTLPFPKAETGSPAAQGIAGVVKQGDVLTPIAPILSARSDSFIIRGYGEKLDSSGTVVLARACCEAVVERDRTYVDASNPPETATVSLNPMNKKWGRRFLILSFRWLNPDEI